MEILTLNLSSLFRWGATSPSQKENQGPIALESCLGIDSDHPLGFGGLGPLQPGDNEDSSRGRNNKRTRCHKSPPLCKVVKFKLLNDLGTMRVFFIGFTNPYDYVETFYQDLEELNIPVEIFKLAEARYVMKGIKAQ